MSERSKSPFLQSVRDLIRVKHLSYRTEEAYLGWIRRFILFHDKRHPKEMGADEVRAFLTHLAVEGKVAASTQNQDFAALLFLYREVLQTTLGNLENVVRAKKPKHLPNVMTKDEMQRLLAYMSGEQWLVANLLYGAGLRLMEALRLRVKDVDFEYRQIVVRDGKGAKDRVTVLPEKNYQSASGTSCPRPLSARRGFAARIRRGLSAVCARPEISESRERMDLAIRFSCR